MQDDSQVAWTDIGRMFRLSMVMWSGRVVALPLTPVVYLMYYHRPIFQRDNLTIPQTWPALLELELVSGPLARSP